MGFRETDSFKVSVSFQKGSMRIPGLLKGSRDVANKLCGGFRLGLTATRVLVATYCSDSLDCKQKGTCRILWLFGIRYIKQVGIQLVKRYHDYMGRSPN